MKNKSLFRFIILISSCVQGNSQSLANKVEEKVQKLTNMAANESVIALNLRKFNQYVRSPIKYYSFVVMFNAMSPSRRCAICRHVYDEFLTVANSFSRSPRHTNKLYFGMVDFDENSDVFQMLHLDTAPVIMHFPAKGKPRPTDSMDFERAGIHAEAIAKWIQDRTNVQIKVLDPPNYTEAVIFVIIISLTGGILYILQGNNLHLLLNSEMWATLAVAVCFTAVSGQMWNRITEPPFLQWTDNGPFYISSGSNNASILLGMILMIESAGGVKYVKVVHDGQERRLKAILGVGLVCIFFSVLISIFRSKTDGYPYSFLFM